MTVETVIQIIQSALLLCVIISAPAVLAALVVGLVVSILQAATQIQEQTLALVPKLIAVFVAILISGYWVLSSVVDFSRQLFEMIPKV